MTILQLNADKLRHALASFAKVLKDKDFGVGGGVKLDETHVLIWAKKRGGWGLWVESKGGDFMSVELAALDLRMRAAGAAAKLVSQLERNAAHAAVDLEVAADRLQRQIATMREEMKKAAEAKAYMSRDRSNDHKK